MSVIALRPGSNTTPNSHHRAPTNDNTHATKESHPPYTDPPTDQPPEPPEDACFPEEATVPTYETLPRFTADLHQLTPDQRRRFRRIVTPGMASTWKPSLAMSGSQAPSSAGRRTCPEHSSTASQAVLVRAVAAHAHPERARVPSGPDLSGRSRRKTVSQSASDAW